MLGFILLVIALASLLLVVLTLLAYFWGNL